MTPRPHTYMNIRLENGDWLVVCSCGAEIRHTSRAVAMAAFTEHALNEYEAAS